MPDFPKKYFNFITRRGLVCGVLGLGLTSCLGSFQVVHLHNAPSYENVDSDEEIKKVTFAHLNAADLRGNTTNLFQFISKEEAEQRAASLADFTRKEKIGIFTFNELDYAGTAKTGGFDQPKIIAEFAGSPHNYVVVDQYMKSPLWTTGNAIISSFPVKIEYRHLYGNQECELDSRLGHLFKDFIHVKVKVGKRELDVITTHLDDADGEFSFRRHEEARELADYVTELKQKNPYSYIVAAGDFNDSYNSKTMKILLSSRILHPPAENFGLKTHQNGNPSKDLDHILASGNIVIHNYKTFTFPWSDHLGLMCELEFLY